MMNCLAVLMGPGEVGIIVALAIFLTIMVSRDRKSVRQAVAVRAAQKSAAKTNKPLLLYVISGLLLVIAILLFIMFRMHNQGPAA